MRADFNAHEIASYGSCLKRFVAKSEIEQSGFGSPPPQHPVSQELSRNLVNGDELWHFSPPPEHWDYLIGESGIAIVRNGAVIAVKILLHN